MKVSQEFDRLASRAELVGAESIFAAPPSLWPNQVFRQGGQASPREKVVPFLHTSPNQSVQTPDYKPAFELNAAVNFNLIAGINQRHFSQDIQQPIPVTVNADVFQEVIPDLDQLMINSAACSMPSDQIPKFDSLLNASSQTSETAASSRTDVDESRFSVTSSESYSEHIVESSSTIDDIHPRSRPCSVTAQKEIPFFGKD